LAQLDALFGDERKSINERDEYLAKRERKSQSNMMAKLGFDSDSESDEDEDFFFQYGFSRDSLEDNERAKRAKRHSTRLSVSSSGDAAGAYGGGYGSDGDCGSAGGCGAAYGDGCGSRCGCGSSNDCPPPMRSLGSGGHSPAKVSTHLPLVASELAEAKNSMGQSALSSRRKSGLQSSRMQSTRRHRASAELTATDKFATIREDHASVTEEVTERNNWDSEAGSDLREERSLAGGNATKGFISMRGDVPRGIVSERSRRGSKRPSVRV